MNKEKQDKILSDRMKAYNAIPGARVGDYIRELNGRMTRATHDWNDDGETDQIIQHGGSEFGQYYLGTGYISYSGGLDTGIRKNQLKDTGKTKPGKVWFFIDDHHCAANGIDYMVDFRVFEVEGEKITWKCKSCGHVNSAIDELCNDCKIPQMNLEKVQTYNGNDQPMTRELPKIVIISKNDLDPIVINHIQKNTDMVFTKSFSGYESQPMTANQIVRLFLTYNFKTTFYNNSTHKNTMFLRFAENE